MWMKLLYLVDVTAALLSVALCAKRKRYRSLTEEDSANKILNQDEPVHPTNPQEKEEPAKSELHSERTDIGCSLGEDNPQIQLVLAEARKKECTAAYIASLNSILDTASTYVWGMKKHMSADQAAWKELAKRITLLHAEGYDVRPGTKEARMRRLVMAKQQSNLMEKVTRKEKKKKKRKAVDDD